MPSATILHTSADTDCVGTAERAARYARDGLRGSRAFKGPTLERAAYQNIQVERAKIDERNRVDAYLRPLNNNFASSRNIQIRKSCRLLTPNLSHAESIVTDDSAAAANGIEAIDRSRWQKA